MSAPKRLRARRYDTQPKLIRMRDLEPEDASWVCYPNSAWLAIESKAEAALMHQNIEFQWEHVDGYELVDFLNETFDSDWRRAPVREHAVRVNQLQSLRDQIDRGHWVVLGWTECNIVEWVDDAGVLGGGRWQLRWQWKSVENGSALVRHLNEMTHRRWRASTPNRTPLSGEPFRAQFDAPKPGVLVADRSGSIWPTMGGSRARTDEDELTGASGRSGDWTSQSKTDLMAQSVANGLNAIAGGGGMLPPGANPGMVLVQSAAMLLAKALPGSGPGNAIFNRGDTDNVGDLQNAANQPINDSGLSAAARAWDKHAGRPGGTFEPLTGPIADKNAAASEFVNSVLNDPNSTRTALSRGGVEYRLPNGQGIRFNADDSFSGFLDPKK